MGARGRGKTLEERTVAPDPLDRSVSPERPSPRPRGTWDVWPVLRDPATPAAIERGELDDVLEELRDYARAHDAAEVVRAADARMGPVAPTADPDAPPSQEVAPWKAWPRQEQ